MIAVKARGPGRDMVRTESENAMWVRAAIWILMAVAACPASAADRESIFRGKRNAEINCGPCHAVALSDESASPAAPPLRELWMRPSFATLRRDMAGSLFLRHAVMPDFEPATEQVSDLADYIESIQDRER